MTLVEALFDDVRQRHPRNLRGLEEARAVDPDRFDRLADKVLGWALEARGDGTLERTVDAFARFSSDVIFAQARYEASGHFEHSSFEECQRAVYDQPEVMEGYLWGVMLTNVLWAHHFELCRFFARSFLPRLPPAAAIVEIAPGHGGWGVWALSERPDARLEGFDISASSVAIASAVAKAAGVADRARYRRLDARAIAEADRPAADAVICCFLIEHLEAPDDLIDTIAGLLPPGAFAFVTGTLTAAQVDHIYEFRHESELVSMCERHGLRVLETYSASPRRTLPKARFLPRSMGLLVERRRGELW